MYNVPKTIREILTTINNHGYEAYIVGGAVRDTILGIENQDYDICTNMPLTKIQELYPKFHMMKPNQNRNTGVMIIDGADIEISEFKGLTIEEDLSKRDFTINAIAADKDGNIIDLYKGIEDLKRKKISLIKKDGIAFQENPLQILRAIRIAAKLNFEIDDNCHTHMIANKDKLNSVAVERIYRELIQLLITDNPAKYIRNNLEVIFEIIPELKPMYKFNQNNPWHIYDVLEHTLVVLENTPKNIFLRFAALFHDIGKPKKYFVGKDNNGHFYGHPEESTQMFDKISTRLKMDKKTTKIVRFLIENHDITLSTKPEKIYEFIRVNGIDYIRLLFELKKADNKGQNPELANPVLEELDKLEEIYSNCILVINNLQISPTTIQKLGIKKNKVRLITDDVIKKVLSGNIPNTEEALITYIERRYK